MTVSVVAKVYQFWYYVNNPLFKTVDSGFDILLASARDAGAKIGTSYVDSGDFDWGIHPTLNVSEWHRYTMSLDKSKDELLLVIDDVLSANYSRAGLSSAAGAGVFSSSNAITLWIGMYASYRMEDDVGSLSLLSDQRFIYGE